MTMVCCCSLAGTQACMRCPRRLEYEAQQDKREQPPAAQQVAGHGWICPRCGAVNAPWMARCTCTATITVASDLPPGTWTLTAGSSDGTSDVAYITVPTETGFMPLLYDMGWAL